MKYQFWIILGLAFLSNLKPAVCVAQEKRLIDQIVGAVGSEVILLSDIEAQLAYMQSQKGAIPPDSRCMVIEGLLSQNLMLNQAKIDSLVVSEDEVETQISTRMDRILALMNNDFQQFEDYYGKPVSEVRADFKDPIRNQILVERMQGSILSSITITPTEVRSFFNRVPKDSLPYFNSEVEMAEILYFPKVNETQKQEAYVKMSRVRKLIVEDKKDFAEVATEYSEDLGSARLGGDLGWQKRGTFVPEFEAVAYNLEPGELSEIFESPFGYHIVQLLERRGNMLHTRHVLIQPKIEQADLDLAKHFLDSLRTEIQKAGEVTFESVMKAHGDKNTQSFNNGGRMMNPKTGNTFFEISDLEHNLFFVIDTLAVGNISAPIAVKDPSGKTYYQLIKLLSRTKPHQASLKQDYARIQEAALSEKKGKHLEEWVEMHINTTYINIADQYKSCPNLGPWFKATSKEKP
ncbi:MAG: peptidylprolyl isomerase [Saprospiraceae bacterium]|nr:peptidylprolyl isomerase [Saprospiraceae bacterium]